MTTANYTVEFQPSDAARPWIVLCNLRSFNRGMGRYPSETKAKARAAALNRQARANECTTEQRIAGCINTMTAALHQFEHVAIPAARTRAAVDYNLAVKTLRSLGVVVAYRIDYDQTPPRPYGHTEYNFSL